MVQRSRHVRVRVSVLRKQFQQVILPCGVGKYAHFNLSAIADDDGVTFRRSNSTPQGVALAFLASTRQVL